MATAIKKHSKKRKAARSTSKVVPTRKELTHIKRMRAIDGEQRRIVRDLAEEFATPEETGDDPPKSKSTAVPTIFDIACQVEYNDSNLEAAKQLICAIINELEQDSVEYLLIAAKAVIENAMSNNEQVSKRLYSMQQKAGKAVAQ